MNNASFTRDLFVDPAMAGPVAVFVIAARFRRFAVSVHLFILFVEYGFYGNSHCY